jgi:thiamine-phosphate diphosphorylase
VLVEVARALRAAAPSVPLLVNDRVDVALAAGAQGVHVGVDDISPSSLRKVMPRDIIIGASVGTDAEVSRAIGADYVGIGPGVRHWEQVRRRSRHRHSSVRRARATLRTSRRGDRRRVRRKRRRQ